MQTYSIIKVANFFGLAASRLIKIGLLLCFGFSLFVFAQINSGQAEIKQAQIEFDNGNHSKVFVLVDAGVEKATKTKNALLIAEGFGTKASSEISLQRYFDAAKSLDSALKAVSETNAAANQTALVYIYYAWLYRSQKKFAESLNYSKKAVAVVPQNNLILAAHYLNIGRILFNSGYDVSAIVWLEKAEKLLESESTNSVKIDTQRFLSLAWWSKLNYQTALKHAEKCASLTEKSVFKYKHRQALFDWQTVLSDSGQEKRAFSILKKGLKLSEAENDLYQASIFSSSLLLHALNANDVTRASDYLRRLEKTDGKKQFVFEAKLGRAIIAAFQNQSEVSEKMFAELDKEEKSSDYAPLYWKIVIAERNQNWEQFLTFNQELLDLTTKENFRSGLPKIHLNFAKAYFHLNKPQLSKDYLQKSLALIEEIRSSENYNLSLGLSENYHDAYRLLAQIKLEDSQESFELADFLKARLLKDRIDDAAVKHQSVISPAIRKTLEELSLKYIEDPRRAVEIEKHEKFVTNVVIELNFIKPDLTELDKIAGFDDTAVVSYFFTLDKKLLAFVKEKGRATRYINLDASENEINDLTKATEQKIKNFIFFKRDGKLIYDKLLKPLSISAKHLIVVPDKSLWKIPFQALSPDGQKYLIEEKTISYAPSAAILIEQLKSEKPNRQILQAFANSTFDNRVLRYANAEAAHIAAIYGAKPKTNASAADFERISDEADILHFAMHAQIDSDEPLNSFLGFSKGMKDDGRLTVEDLLKIKLKKRSLVFLASCDTNNVLNGEGLISLAWAMMGSGATTVISAQWEADDKSTQNFTRLFYRFYREGNSAAEAMQKASLALIKNKSKNLHEPYYWGNYTLNGDYR